MDDSTIITLFGNVALGLLKRLGSTLWSKISNEPIVWTAIRATADAFPDLEGIDKTLSEWCASEQFGQQIEQMNSGSRDLTGPQVVEAFLSSTQFSAGDETTEKACHVLSTFLSHLEHQLYKSAEGIPLLVNRMERMEAGASLERQQIHHGQAIIQKTLQSHLPPDEVERRVEDSALHTRLDETRNLLNEGKPITARQRLLVLRSEVATKTVSPGVLFRIATNLGAAALSLDELDVARTEFDTALQHQPKSQKALSNCAQVALRLGDKGRALELAQKAYEIDAYDPYASSMYVGSLHATGEEAKLHEVLEQNPWMDQDPQVLLTLGLAAYEDKQLDRAECYLRKSIAKTPRNPLAWHLLGCSIVMPIQQQFEDRPLVPWLISDIEKQRLAEAEGAFSTALQLVEGYEVQCVKHPLFLNRAATRSMLQNFTGALADCDRILSEDPTKAEAWAQRGLLLMSKHKDADAADSFASAAEKGHQDLAVPHAFCCLRSGQPTKAKQLLLPLWASLKHGRARTHVAELLLDAAAQGVQSIPSSEIIAFLEQRATMDPLAISVLAQEKVRQGNTEEAVKMLSDAVRKGEGSIQAVLRLELGDLCYDLGKFEEAVNAYREVVDTRSDNVPCRKYLISLFKSGAYKETLRLVQDLRNQGPAIPVISELESLVLESVGDLDTAGSLRLQLAEAEPKKPDHVLHLASIYERKGDRNGAADTLKILTMDRIGGDARILMAVARFRDRLELPKVLQYAYKARRIDAKNEQMHLFYVCAFLNREEDKSLNLDPDKVAAGCTVWLKRDDEEPIYYHVVDDGIADATKQEIQASSAAGKVLLGKTVGDIVDLPSGPLDDNNRYEVKEIQSCYVFAFQDTLRNYAKWFPGETGLQGVKEEPGKIDKFLRFVGQHDDRARELLRSYQDNLLPVGTLAQLLGKSIIEVWGGLTSLRNGRLAMQSGRPEDTQAELLILKGCASIVLDTTALYTLSVLDLQSHVKERFGRIVIPQAVVDDLRDTMALLTITKKPSMTLYKEDGQFCRGEITEQDVARRNDFFKQILSFIEASCDVVPVPGQLDLSSDKVENLQLYLGKTSLAAVLTAQDQQLPLYSDDHRLRLFAKGEFGLNGVCTQNLLVDLFQRRSLTQEQRSKAVVQLVSLNYHFVSINDSDLIWALDESGARPSQQVQKLFERLQGDQCDEDPAINLVAEVLKKVWVGNPALRSSPWLVPFAITRLLVGRRPARVLHKLKAAINDRFYLVPLHRVELLQQIDLFFRQRFGPS